MATRVDRKKIRLTSFNGPSMKTPYKRKNFADISYISRVIANFVPKFVAMVTRVARGKIRLAAFDGPFPKTPYRHKILQISFTQTELWLILSQNSLPWNRSCQGKI